MYNDINELCDLTRETSFSVHNYLRFGHLEKIYENSLSNRLRKKGLDIKQQYPIKVHDEDGTLLGDFYADIFAENQLIVEIKACKTLASEHTVQLYHFAFRISESHKNRARTAHKFWSTQIIN